MSAEILYSQIRFVSVISEIAASKGIHIRVCTDFEAFQKALKEQDEAPPIYPMFDPACSFVDPANGFWIMGADDKGELVHTQAVRRLDLSNSSLAEHLSLHHQKYVLQGQAIDKTRSIYDRAPAWQNITGSVCYHGQVWLKGGKKGYRDRALTATLPRLALALSFMKWSPDYVFGFINPLLACGGLAAREGYAHMEPGIWHVPDGLDSDQTWLIWVDNDDIEHLMRFPPDNLFRKLAAKDPRRETISAPPLATGLDGPGQYLLI